MGPTCDKVQQAYEIHVMQYIKKGGVKLRHYIPVVVFDAGNLPYDLAQHIYMGIGFKPAGMFDEPKLYGWIDPWRYGHTEVYLPGTGPNSPDQIIPMN